jgi:prepilin-type N-terminal cleavage/methylation domain-containing protein
MTAQKDISDRDGPGRMPDSRQTGFTLVEALVVAVLIGILSAVAIPMYSGYIKNQRRQAATAVAQTVSVTASSLQRRTAMDPTSADFLAKLKTSLAMPDPTRFDLNIKTYGGVNYVVIGEKSGGDTAMGLARF